MQIIQLILCLFCSQASFLNKKLNLGGRRINLSIWDTAGQERFHALGPIYYRASNGAILVYDITDEDSFQKVYTKFLLFSCFSRTISHLSTQFICTAILYRVSNGFSRTAGQIQHIIVVQLHEIVIK
jgi:hypothetical protein